MKFDHAFIFNNLGVIYQKLNSNSKARAMFEKSIAKDSSFVKAYRNYLKLLIKENDLKKVE